jgi:uncharacterized repeat protein (TIGR03803 family)
MSLGRVAFIAVLGLSSFVGLQVSYAQLTILHSFGDGTVSNDGANPTTGLIQAPDGNFYGGTTEQVTPTGLAKTGTIYRMTPAGVVTILNAFGSKSHKSASANFLFYKGKLVEPVVVQQRKTPPAEWPGSVVATKLTGKMTTWHTLAVSDGTSPDGSLILGSDGYLYGTSFGGGTSSDGTIYKINPTSPFAFTVVYNFSSSSAGIHPEAGLLLAQDGNYYGTTATGPNGGGAIFQMTPAGQVTFVYQFPGTTDFCNSPLIQDKSGNFYGSTFDGGAHGAGYAFKMSSTLQVTVLHQFDANDGGDPNTLVLGPNGNLYGTTYAGGSAARGNIFELSTDGASYTVLHTFDDGSVPNDGYYPRAGLTLGSDNNLYGTTSSGGSAGYGTIFRITP